MRCLLLLLLSCSLAACLPLPLAGLSNTPSRKGSASPDVSKPILPAANPLSANDVAITEDDDSNGNDGFDFESLQYVLEVVKSAVDNAELNLKQQTIVSGGTAVDKCNPRLALTAY